MQRLDHYWYSLNPVAVALWPVAWLFGKLMILRRFVYRQGWMRSYRVKAPVIVVGNLSVGGTGKTPLVARLVEVLRDDGYRPGIVSRGYGGQYQDGPRLVTPDSNPVEVGDEPVLLARRCRCPVVVAPDRAAAAHYLLDRNDCNVVLSDNGLQHYALARDIEIVVVDGMRRFGNGACLPAGPLREPLSRLNKVDFIVANGAARSGEYLMTLAGERAVNLTDAQVSCALSVFCGDLVHAVAGIGNPGRFFAYLRERGIRVLEDVFPDHYVYTAGDLTFGDDLPVLMTEKDAVKCRTVAHDRFWYVPVQAQLDPEFERQLLICLDRCFANRAAARI